ncbi:MAG: chemotaxis protein CheX [Kangiellaceae bacterium]|nr:chemotaxis protein CheX [Kangiellaceae bacterium]
MEDKHNIQSKALIFEVNEEDAEKVGHLCETFSISGLRTRDHNSLEFLNQNTDLGAIFISEKCRIDDKTGEELVLFIHALRAELPIFMRLDEDSSQELSSELKAAIACAYKFSDLKVVEDSIKRHIFTTFYPVPLVRGMQEISLEAIEANMNNCIISVDPPYLVKDQIIYGELMSLIPIQSNWYRGSMMLQTTEAEIIQLIENCMTPLNPKDTGFRYVNSLLNEITNLIWGGIKRRFGRSDDSVNESLKTQVPISVNHARKYISFGTEEPQLCFHYQIRNKFQEDQVFDIYQRFIFNLDWYPDNFEESDDETNKLIESGELEFF